MLTVVSPLCLAVEMTVGKDQEVTVKSKGAGGQGKVGAKVTSPSGKPVASKVWPHWNGCLSVFDKADVVPSDGLHGGALCRRLSRA